jgi:hypothetical protein
MATEGATIIEAWLHQLELTQPSHGPLLRSTVEAVGPPPAVYEDGSIESIGNGIKYWVAAGFTQSYASLTADRFRTDAWLNYGKAETAGDELRMVDELARARFWESVGGWAATVDPLPIRPEKDPSWLTELTAG